MERINGLGCPRTSFFFFFLGICTVTRSSILDPQDKRKGESGVFVGPVVISVIALAHDWSRPLCPSPPHLLPSCFFSPPFWDWDWVGSIVMDGAQ
ncbi:MAG: hypothetical protein BYD32DRAFT_155940 [Podila humilis]|nr:MAG: hypothetical protein BYD32DRAFT_155940 [Podila humilis]